MGGCAQPLYFSFFFFTGDAFGLSFDFEDDHTTGLGSLV